MIGLLLVAIAVVLAMETKSLLLGESATKDDVGQGSAAPSRPTEHRIIHLKTLHLGPEELLVAAKIGVGAADTGQDIARAIDDAEGRIREAVPIARVIYLEPDVQRVTRPPDRRPAGLPGVPDGGRWPEPAERGYGASGLLRSSRPLSTATPRPRMARTAPTRAGAT